MPTPTSECNRVLLSFYSYSFYCESFGSQVFGGGVIRGRIQTSLGQMSWTAMTLLFYRYCVTLFCLVIVDSTW